MQADSLSRRHVRAGAPLRARTALAALALLLALPLAANAYTLVLRSGRHVTVPDAFQVTPTAVIYEASPGFRVTVWLSSIDVAATERANAEPAGSFLKRIGQSPASPAAAPAQTTGATKTSRRGGAKVVTNRELEPSRLRREAQEEEYERTRSERRMPSLRELQERAAERDRDLHEWAEAERRRAELESMKEELVSVRRRLDELGLNLSRQADAYGPAYDAPYDYPYLYAPPVNLIIVRPFGHPFGHRGLFGRGRFGGFRPHHRPRHFDNGLGRAFSLNNNAAPPNNARGMGRALPTPGTAPPRRH